MLQNPLSPSTVNFVSQKLQALTLCDNIEAVTWSSHEVIQPLSGFIFCEKLTIQFLKENCGHVKISWLILSWKKEDNYFSISVCQPSSLLWLTRNWITCSKSLNVQPKSTSHSDLFSITSNMERVDTVNHTKSIQLWRSPNSFVLQRRTI